MTKKYSEIYVSTDVETDGPIPGDYSMLSIGSVAFAPNGKMLGKFVGNLKRIKNAKQDPRTLDFWKKFPDKYRKATLNAKSPKNVMKEYYFWLKNLQKKLEDKTNLIFLGWPLTFDYMFVYWYLIKFVEELKKADFMDIPFSYNRGLDVNSFAMAHLKKSYRKSMPLKNNFNKKIFINPESGLHDSLSDAMAQGKTFINILKLNQGIKK